MSALDLLSGQVLRSTAGTIYTSAKASYWSDAGATTPLTVYSDAGLSSAHTNPVVADGTTGAFPAIFLQARRYWRTVTDSAGVSLPQFNIGPIDHHTLLASGSAPSPTYPFLRYYSQPSLGGDGNVYRRNAANSAWINEGPVDSLINAATVAEVLAGTATDKAATPDSIAGLWQRGPDITAASTLSLPAAGGNSFLLSGTATTITGISSANGGHKVRIRYNAAHPLTHNGTSLILQGGASRTVAAGAISVFENDAAMDATGSNWREVDYTSSTGSPASITDFLASQSDAETGTSTTKAPSVATQVNHPGHPKAWVNFNGTGAVAITASYNVTSITDNGVGDYTVNFTTAFSNANYSLAGVARSSGAITFVVGQDTGDTKTTTACQIHVRRGSTDAAVDSAEVNVQFYGDR